jgi:hypothetical protein
VQSVVQVQQEGLTWMGDQRQRQVGGHHLQCFFLRPLLRSQPSHPQL